MRHFWEIVRQIRDKRVNIFLKKLLRDLVSECPNADSRAKNICCLYCRIVDEEKRRRVGGTSNSTEMTLLTRGREK